MYFLFRLSRLSRRIFIPFRPEGIQTNSVRLCVFQLEKPVVWTINLVDIAAQ